MTDDLERQLAAIDHFYLFLGLDQPRVKREDLPEQSPRSLKPEEQKAFLRAVERTPSVRDQAIARLLFYTGLRLGECAASMWMTCAFQRAKGSSRRPLRQGRDLP